MDCSSGVCIVANDKLYMTSQARIVAEPKDLPVEMAASIKDETLNDSFLWIAGRYVQAEQANRNGQYWTLEDLQKGEDSIRHTPLNVLHEIDKPVGTFVETKLIHRDVALENGHLLPEIQALSVVWAANFPHVATAIRLAHDQNKLWYSMECIAEAKECLECNRSFDWNIPNSLACAHLANDVKAPRRFKNPTFLGGGLIFPPTRPGWSDADVTEVANELTLEYANRDFKNIDKEAWESMMALATSSVE